MSQAIKCDKCGKFDDSIESSCLTRADINFYDLFAKHYYPDKVDLCEQCTKELLDFIREWCKKI